MGISGICLAFRTWALEYPVHCHLARQGESCSFTILVVGRLCPKPVRMQNTHNHFGCKHFNVSTLRLENQKMESNITVSNQKMNQILWLRTRICLFHMSWTVVRSTLENPLLPPRLCVSGSVFIDCSGPTVRQRLMLCSAPHGNHICPTKLPFYLSRDSQAPGPASSATSFALVLHPPPHSIAIALLRGPPKHSHKWRRSYIWPCSGKHAHAQQKNEVPGILLLHICAVAGTTWRWRRR